MATGPHLAAHRLMGSSLSTTGDLVEGRTHLDKAIALYDRAEDSPLATRFGQDVGVVTLSWRSWTAWVLGYPEAALADADIAVKNAREIGHAPTLMYALLFASFTHAFCGNYATARALSDEFVALAGRKRSFVLGGARDDQPRLLIGPDWRRCRRRRHDHIRAVDLPINRSNRVRALVRVNVGGGLCETRTVQRRVALYSRGDDSR